MQIPVPRDFVTAFALTTTAMRDAGARSNQNPAPPPNVKDGPPPTLGTSGPRSNRCEVIVACAALGPAPFTPVSPAGFSRASAAAAVIRMKCKQFLTGSEPRETAATSLQPTLGTRLQWPRSHGRLHWRRPCYRREGRTRAGHDGDSVRRSPQGTGGGRRLRLRRRLQAGILAAVPRGGLPNHRAEREPDRLANGKLFSWKLGTPARAAQANRISSSGFDKSGKDCHNALRMTLCYLAYPRCDPTTGHLPPVCDSMRRSALLACTPALGEFRDKSVILAELPEERFSDNSIDCYPDNNPVPENPVVGGEILPDDEVANNTGVELTPAPDAVALASNDSDNAENKVRPAAGPPPGALTPSAVTVTVTEPLSPFTVPPDIGGISPAVDPTTNTSSASIGIPSTSKNSITPGNTTQAVTTGTGSGERICSNSDLIFFYGDCLANGTRTIECSLRPDVQCKDVWMLTKKVHVEQCG
ncbi:MAG: hypothetical protein BJ554DRAFT_6719 [Olpidium bornovanus]|uniref:Uncharacterized protein n=1 Tax=Olpidium bornovanus TaxID=278681 RepID=A0A8H8DJZ8_9FUNG|nr:MAG: hypothetical protein BJ554DRAFT_6719 [Olpidium bornovanus]